MPTLRRVATATATVAGALVATLALTTTPAYADDAVKVDLGGIGGSINAGGRSFESFIGTYTNETDNTIANIRATFTIHLDGLTPDGVRIQRLEALGAALPSESAGDGTVRITDPLSFDLGHNNRRQTRYLLQFTSAAPSGEASITLELFSGGNRLGGDSASINVRGSGEPTKTTPPNTNPGIVPTFEAGPTYSLAPLPESNSDLVSTNVPASLYVMGGVLVALGGVILFLLFRRPRPGASVAYSHRDEEIPAPSLRYPRPAPHPTATLPNVRDPQPPHLPPHLPPQSPPRRPRP